MAKRFADTELYDRAWFRKIEPRLKCAWEWLRLRCDAIGVWNIDMERLSFEVGEPVTLEEIQKAFKVKVISDDELFIPGFVPFQYGDEAGRLSSRNKLHLSIARRLHARGLPVPIFRSDDPEPITNASPMDTGCIGDASMDAQGKGKGKEQGKGNGKGEGKGEGKGNADSPPEPVVTPVPVQQIHPLGVDDLARCFEAWRGTLAHFKIPRALLASEQTTITRGIQRNGAQAVRLALIGARHEPKTGDFDPGQHVNVDRIFHKTKDGKDRFPEYLNWGTAALAREEAQATKVKPTDPAPGEYMPPPDDIVSALRASVGLMKEMPK